MSGWWRWLFGETTDVRAPLSDAEPPGVLNGYSREDIDRAALRMVHGRIPFVFPSYLGGSLYSVGRAVEEISKMRAEYATIQPPRLRRAIMRWLDYFANDVDEKRQDIEGQVTKKQQDRYRAERDRENARTDAIIARLKR